MNQNYVTAMVTAIDNATKALTAWGRSYGKLKRSHRRWTMQNKNGQNTKTRKRNQVMLKGRGCRTHKGQYPHRGPGRTAHGRRN